MKYFTNSHKKLELILLGLIVLALIVIIGNELRLLGEAKANKEVAKAVEIVKVESNLITTKEDYDALLQECIDFIRDNYTTYSTVNTDIIVSEETYVDSEEIEIEDGDTLFNHANAVYCKGMLLVSFLSDNGKMKSVAAAIDKKADNIVVVDITNISAFEKFNEYNLDSKIDSIVDIIVSVLKYDSHKLDTSDTYKYFTSRGYEDFISEIDNSVSISNAEIAFVKVGKSKQNLDYNDRIILQVLTVKDSSKIYITSLIKINKDGKIFDIDII